MAFDIKREMAAFDTKNRDFFKNLTDDERKNFSNFMMIRWGATVDSNEELQRYYLRSVNERLNTHFFDISGKDHAQLHWLLATTVSPGVGKLYHPWVGFKKKTGTSNGFRRLLETHFPSASNSEIDLLLKINDSTDIKQFAKDLGMSPAQIKKELKC